MSIKIFLADDHRIMREGLRAMLEKKGGLEVIGEAGDGRTAVRLVKEMRPDIIIMDIGMPELNGIEATRRIIKNCPGVKIIALSIHSDKRLVSEMLKAGASGYVLKEAAFSELIDAIHTVKRGCSYISVEIQDVINKKLSKHPLYSELTDREREVLQLLAEGKSTKQIASCLDVSAKTIDSHRQQIMKKLNMHSVAQLTKYAIREGITSI
ncbi:MAG: response regulator transcription factor [Nitrospirae bacterium]|nr:response regulator transcription factor [Nitrospirota bacterium]